PKECLTWLQCFSLFFDDRDFCNQFLNLEAQTTPITQHLGKEKQKEFYLNLINEFLIKKDPEASKDILSLAKSSRIFPLVKWQEIFRKWEKLRLEEKNPLSNMCLEMEMEIFYPEVLKPSEQLSFLTHYLTSSSQSFTALLQKLEYFSTKTSPDWKKSVLSSLCTFKEMKKISPKDLLVQLQSLFPEASPIANSEERFFLKKLFTQMDKEDFFPALFPFWKSCFSSFPKEEKGFMMQAYFQVFEAMLSFHCTTKHLDTKGPLLLEEVRQASVSTTNSFVQWAILRKKWELIYKIPFGPLSLEIKKGILETIILGLSQIIPTENEKKDLFLFLSQWTPIIQKNPSDFLPLYEALQLSPNTSLYAFLHLQIGFLLFIQRPEKPSLEPIKGIHFFESLMSMHEQELTPVFSYLRPIFAEERKPLPSSLLLMEKSFRNDLLNLCFSHDPRLLNNPKIQLEKKQSQAIASYFEMLEKKLNNQPYDKKRFETTVEILQENISHICKQTKKIILEKTSQELSPSKFLLFWENIFKNDFLLQNFELQDFVEFFYEPMLKNPLLKNKERLLLRPLQNHKMPLFQALIEKRCSGWNHITSIAEMQKHLSITALLISPPFTIYTATDFREEVEWKNLQKSLLSAATKKAKELGPMASSILAETLQRSFQ
ncbi:MAG: hypothetical protein WCP39_02560, partial [Chlamydiota bacterium]